MASFHDILTLFRKESATEREKGARFERLMQLYLRTEPFYASRFKNVWLWEEFPFRKDLGGSDTGIDLVAQTTHGAYWAIQCKCYQESATINKAEIDSFLTTAGRSFMDESGMTTRFEHCLWISTTNKWSSNAEEAIKNHTPAVSRISLYHLQNSSVEWDKIMQGLYGEQSLKSKHKPLEHQKEAVAEAITYYQEQKADRGKLIMACGTGKTFTSLKIAEKITTGEGLVLFLVPSIALLGQTLEEWLNNAEHPISPICICSDPEVSKRKNKNEDTDSFSVVDLALPASTDTDVIIKQLEQATADSGITVVFSTYQSIDVIAKAQTAYQKKTGSGKGIFDLIICDEAHRTTGVTLSNEDESAFVKVHNNSFIQAKKRMYMTATPRLYHDDAKKKAVDNDMVLCSMDDVSIYGEEFYHIGFGTAVSKGLLSDYKVLILTVNENDMTASAQNMVARGETEIPVGDVNKLIGCVNALSKEIVGDDGIVKTSDPEPMCTAVAFCQNIKVSKQITNTFNQMSDLYYKELSDEQQHKMLMVESDHIDGTMAATTRGQKLSWLKSVPKASMQCRILTNVRCLSEGVDVPSLDAVMFLSARNSQVDVVQSVGRVMRRAPGKKYGYIIIPIVVPADVQGEKALSNNSDYAVVWTVLNALRAHDDRFKATINKIELNKHKPESIIIGGASHGKDDINGAEYVGADANAEAALQMAIRFDNMQSLLYAKLVDKVGERRYWEQWARDVADIAVRQIKNIRKLVENDKKHQREFEKFLKGLHKNINPSVSEEDAIEMLAQHLITQPVFEALFENYSFVRNNPISQSMEKMLALLEEQKDEKDTETLQKFYDSVRERAEDIDNAEAKQKIIIELYDKFFRTAFPVMVERLGIIYTPVEVVDYIVHSVDAVLCKEFDRTLSDENLHILDPFTGTGTFITRLLQSGLIKPEDLKRKYSKEIHANEIVLLAYYIASVNIENVYHDLQGDGSGAYTPFNGICLTDTFQLGETKNGEDLFSEMFPQNSRRVQEQQKAPLRVIIGNPPYSVGQQSANDNAQNQSYSKLEKRIEETYAKGSSATSVKALYDAYIKAFRWSGDRLDPKNGGVICFVSNGAWIDGNGMDGFRHCLEKEFSSIYVFNLRGNQRTSGELSRKEGGKIFGSGSRTPISITLLVKKPEHKGRPVILYHDIGDYLSREEKLEIIRKLGSMDNPGMRWQTLSPNEHNDWVNHRNDKFGEFTPLATDKKFDTKTQSVFTTYSLGVASGRDSWVYNFSKEKLIYNIQRTINNYNEEVDKYSVEKTNNPKISVDQVIDHNPQKVSWNRNFKQNIEKGKKYSFNSSSLYIAQYRPFCTQEMYFDGDLNAMLYQNKKLFPTAGIKNVIICISSSPNDGLSVLISDKITDLHFNGDTQCFPLYWYEETKQEKTLFDSLAEPENEYYARRYAISDFALNQARNQYGSKTTKEDIFYYVYGFLHNPDYRVEFAVDLKKMLPRIPFVADSTVFWKYVKAGRELAQLHLHYEDYANEAAGVTININNSVYDNFEVTKMRFASKEDKSAIIYNPFITLAGIPAEAYEYVVNGRSAIEWIMESYQIKTHKESGIVNDPNDWAREHNKARYILDLLLSIITVSMRTVEIVKGLPRVEM
ncbi:MAG: DEAD/DEAH box helicase family protein [Prevotellaceae bacterium]|jgi:predicted helicase|nr:DEAD/DEAH box helicase family protein [Prevotellaceae bacterium]